MRVILDVLHGPRKGRTFVFDSHDTFIVGRSRFVHCPIPEDSALSRDHFLIEINPPRCELRDLGSTNGTFVNERRVERSRLGSGDQIVAGQSVFRVRVDGVPTHVGEVRSPTGSRIDVAALAFDGMPITCAGCGMLAPPDLDVASDSGEEMAGAILWWCELCRAEVAATPQPVPHYTTLRELGRGAMGVVYQARHNQTGRMVALKLIVPESAAARTAIERFLREMSVIEQLKHPHIVEFLEQGFGPRSVLVRDGVRRRHEPGGAGQREQGEIPDPPGVPDGLPGPPRARAGPQHGVRPPRHQAREHPDRPDARGPGGEDLRLRPGQELPGHGPVGLTFSGEMRGTIPFMPPEQMLDFKTVLPSGDLYATAATLYYLITGQFIYDQVAVGGDLIRALLEESPVPIQQRRPDVPDGLAAVLMKCLSREPEDRYPTAYALRQALREFC